MVGTIERDEAFGVPRCLEYLAGIVDADHLVGRRVEDEEGAAQLRQPRRLVVPARLGEELLADPKLSASQFDFRLSLRLDPLRSEEHTSALQSLMRTSYAVFCLKKQKHRHKTST